MHRTVLMLAVLATFAPLAFSSPAQAAATDRYCLRGRPWGFPGNCQFATRPQCLAAASGTTAYCGINPRYASSRRR